MYSNGGSGSTFNLLRTTSISSGIEITPLVTGSTHIFRISAENLYGEGPLSSQFSVLVATEPSQPAKVT